VQQQFYRDEPTARTSWRQAILMGVNTRTYKFALGAALLDLADTGRDAVPLVELASTYATHLVNRTGDYPQASSSLQLSDTDFLSVLARERNESVANNAPTEALVDAATRSIPGMVMDKFHNLPGEDKVAHTFYEIQGRGPNRIVRLTPDLQAVAASGTGLLDEELESRWRIVEAWFDAGIGRSLVRQGVDGDVETGGLIARTRRVPLTSLRSAIVGFQYGRCFYCNQPVGDLGPDVHVDHVFSVLVDEHRQLARAQPQRCVEPRAGLRPLQSQEERQASNRSGNYPAHRQKRRHRRVADTAAPHTRTQHGRSGGERLRSATPVHP
jgi:hypothetical protein